MILAAFRWNLSSVSASCWVRLLQAVEAYSSCGRMYSLYMLDRACLFSPLSLSRLRSPRRRRVFEITVLSCVPHCRLLLKVRPRCFCVVVIGRLVFPRESCSKAVFSVQTERVKRRDDDFVGLTKRDEAVNHSSVRVTAGWRAWRASEAVSCTLIRAVSSANRLQET